MRMIAALSLILASSSLGCLSQNRMSNVLDENPATAWFDDYTVARTKAIEEKKLLFLFIETKNESTKRDIFFNTTIHHDANRAFLGEMVLARISAETEVTIGNKTGPILSLLSAEFTHHSDAIMIADFASESDGPTYGQFISALPFRTYNKYSHYDLTNPLVLREVFDLPIAPIAERSLIYAVRLHPEKGLSTSGYRNPYLVKEAEIATDLQVKLDFQGHPQWENVRFHRIDRNLGQDFYPPYENAAESWPDDLTYIEGALECMDSWKHSDGHWAGVLWAWTDYAYHMRRNEDGRWFCTGIYAQQRNRPKYPESLRQVLIMNKGL